ASAQAPGQTAVLPAAPASPHKDTSIAVGLSIGATVGSFVLLGMSDDSEKLAALGLAGIYLGPSTGQWYAGRIGGIGLASRAVAAVLVVEGVARADQPGNDCLGLTDAECRDAEARWDHDSSVGEKMIVGGLLLWAGSSVFD